MTSGSAAPSTKVSIARIQDQVSQHFGFSHIDLISARRSAKLVRARHVAMYLSKQLVKNSLCEIGRRFGGRDHSGVLYAARKITSLLASDEQLAADIEVLRGKLAR